MLTFVLTCEHGGNNIPAAYQALFKGHEQVLRTHAGYDIGGLELFKELEPLADSNFYSETSRLLVELNRSLHHQNLFSDISQILPDKEKERVLDKYYFPYRNSVEQTIQTAVEAGKQVLHIAVHSFTPVLKGEVRKADIGLLYDPKREGEQLFCQSWKAALKKEAPQLVVRSNYPYLGTADGFPTYLRKKYKASEYLGIELEVNQKYPEGEQAKWTAVKAWIYTSLAETLQTWRAG